MTIRAAHNRILRLIQIILEIFLTLICRTTTDGDYYTESPFTSILGVLGYTFLF